LVSLNQFLLLHSGCSPPPQHIRALLIQQLAGVAVTHTVTAQRVRDYRDGAATQKAGPAFSRNAAKV
jgi:hypothetical protein